MKSKWLYPVYLLFCRFANWEVMRLREFARKDLDQWAMLWWAFHYHMGGMRPDIPLEPYYQRMHRNQLKPWQCKRIKA